MEELGIVETPKVEEVVAPKPTLSTTYDELDSDDLYVRYSLQALPVNSGRLELLLMLIYSSYLYSMTLVLQVQEAAAAARVPGGAGGVHQGRAEEPQEGVPACPGGGQEDPVRPAGEHITELYFSPRLC